MRKNLALTLAAATALSLTACSGASSPAENKETASSTADAVKDGGSTAAEEGLPQWPFTDKETTFYTRNNAGTSVALAQQYLLDIVFDGLDAAPLLTSDATSGGAVCVDKTYAAGGDGYTFYMSGSEMVIGDILGTFDYSLKDDFQVLGMIPSNGAPNFLSVSKQTLPDVTTMEELVDYCKANPGKVRFGYGPDTLGEVYATLFIDEFDLDVKMTISEGQDSKPNMMGGIVDVVFWNQRDSIEYGDYIRPVVALSNSRSTKEELKNVPCYKEKGLEDCVVPSMMFLVCRNDIDPALAQSINNAWNAAIEDAVSDSPSEKGQMLREYMAGQDQTLEPMTIDEMWAVIDDEYAKIGEVLGAE